MTSSVTKRNPEKSVDKTTKSKDDVKDKNSTKAAKNFKYGPLPNFPGQRMWSRGVLVIGVLIYLWYFSKGTKDSILSKQTEVYVRRSQIVECGPEYIKDIKQYEGCVPKKCGRFVSDKLVTEEEADILLKLAVRIMARGGSSGGASIVDLHTGALSYRDKFINIYQHNGNKKILTETERKVYELVRKNIQSAIAESFGINTDSLHLTYPTFFSRLSNVDPKTRHDEYWHEHIDKRTYEAFHYTSLLYLNDYGKDFKGGRFIFMDNISAPTKNVTVEPRKGRVSMFTSGSENPHYVERVTEGLRFAITISFTCDATKAILDPAM
ncbi:2-oxoglutarate and iron-dependent oxygenase domain-containing protein 3-like [Diorhabda carinulata]|uniref:2-oxoglutarate and iron-dependent oxygenase domain-containing protein 3-like n=1 Tax=Diorhabda carinulata TaxID=1163345 RepID=UPI0025A230E6|nr:2-oxoglutarate and iron-dependent oxygenase domain-containing protein 3-like [Diorhabda carinulata]